MDLRLLSTVIDEACLGNRTDDSWTTQVYNNIVDALRQSGLAGLTKNNIKNRQNVMNDMSARSMIYLMGLVDLHGTNSLKHLKRKMKSEIT